MAGILTLLSSLNFIGMNYPMGGTVRRVHAGEGAGLLVVWRAMW
jgi:hypothetical protein